MTTARRGTILVGTVQPPDYSCKSLVLFTPFHYPFLQDPDLPQVQDPGLVGMLPGDSGDGSEFEKVLHEVFKDSYVEWGGEGFLL